jgi:hypothetical protein
MHAPGIAEAKAGMQGDRGWFAATRHGDHLAKAGLLGRDQQGRQQHLADALPQMIGMQIDRSSQAAA